MPIGAEAIDDIEPCGRTSCGWQHESREGIKAEKLKRCLDIISIKAKGGSLLAVYEPRRS